MNLFFPSHDIALANGVKHFNPPKAALILQKDLSWLEGIFSHSSLAPEHSLIPWGWDWDTREYMIKEHHINRSELPTDEQLEELRQLSSRCTLIPLLNALDFKGQFPEYLRTESAVLDYIKRHDEKGVEFVLKTPWSSSGRGLIRSAVTPRPVMLKRAITTIKKMGGIMAEEWLPKKQDFALLYFVGNNSVQFIGYSLFDNEESGTYRQGYLLSNDEIERRLNLKELPIINARLQAFLQSLFTPFYHLPWQIGYLGVDMMTLSHSTDSTESSWACCEMNLRCTMGIVARLWSDAHLSQGQKGSFIISPMGDDGHFQAQFLIE